MCKSGGGGGGGGGWRAGGGAHPRPIVPAGRDPTRFFRYFFLLGGGRGYSGSGGFSIEQKKAPLESGSLRLLRGFWEGFGPKQTAGSRSAATAFEKPFRRGGGREAEFHLRRFGPVGFLRSGRTPGAQGRNPGAVRLCFFFFGPRRGSRDRSGQPPLFRRNQGASSVRSAIRFCPPASVFAQRGREGRHGGGRRGPGASEGEGAPATILDRGWESRPGNKGGGGGGRKKSLLLENVFWAANNPRGASSGCP